MEHLTLSTFKQKVFDYDSSSPKLTGDLPCIIDFYADWCGPCKMIAPILEDLSKEYNGKINIYKVNTQDEQELAAKFGITGIPTIIFVPKNGDLQITTGAMPKQAFVDNIKNILKVQ